MMGKTAQDHSRVGVAVKLKYSGGWKVMDPSTHGPPGGVMQGSSWGQGGG